LSATVALFGLISDPHQVSALIDAVSLYAPRSVTELATEQLERLLHADASKLAFHGGVSIIVGPLSGQQGGRPFFRALTIVNERGRRRGFWGRYLAGASITLGAVIAAMTTVFAFTFAAAIAQSPGANAALQILRPIALVGLMTIFALALYRWGPARR